MAWLSVWLGKALPLLTCPLLCVYPTLMATCLCTLLDSVRSPEMERELLGEEEDEVESAQSEGSESNRSTEATPTEHQATPRPMTARSMKASRLILAPPTVLPSTLIIPPDSTRPSSRGNKALILPETEKPSKPRKELQIDDLDETELRDLGFGPDEIEAMMRKKKVLTTSIILSRFFRDRRLKLWQFEQNEEKIPGLEQESASAATEHLDMEEDEVDLSSVPDAELQQILQVRILRLDGLGITAISGLDPFTSLTHLYLQRNDIVEIENLDALINLRYLNLANNRIKRIPLDALEGLEKLRVLDLSENQIETLDAIEGAYFPDSIQFLRFNGNPCTKLTGFRELFVGCLPNLIALDDVRITDEEKAGFGLLTEGTIEEDEDDGDEDDDNDDEDPNVTASSQAPGSSNSEERDGELERALVLAHPRLQPEAKQWRDDLSDNDDELDVGSDDDDNDDDDQAIQAKIDAFVKRNIQKTERQIQRDSQEHVAKPNPSKSSSASKRKQQRAKANQPMWEKQLTLPTSLAETSQAPPKRPMPPSKLQSFVHDEDSKLLAELRESLSSPTATADGTNSTAESKALKENDLESIIKTLNILENNDGPLLVRKYLEDEISRFPNLSASLESTGRYIARDAAPPPSARRQSGSLRPASASLKRLSTHRATDVQVAKLLDPANRSSTPSIVSEAPHMVDVLAGGPSNAHDGFTDEKAKELSSLIYEETERSRRHLRGLTDELVQRSRTRLEDMMKELEKTEESCKQQWLKRICSQREQMRVEIQNGNASLLQPFRPDSAGTTRAIKNGQLSSSR